MMMPYEGKFAPAFLRAPGSAQKVSKFINLSFGCLLIVGITSRLGCRGCCGDFFPNVNKPAIDLTRAELLGLAKILVIAFSGFWIGLLWNLIKSHKARLLMRQLLSSCVTDGSLRAAYERKIRFSGAFEWAVYDMRKGGHNLRRLAGRAIRGECAAPMYLAFRIPAEKALQQIEQYKLITKNGYEIRPAAEFPYPKMLLRDGSIVQFYYQAEYVRIWG